MHIEAKGLDEIQKTLGTLEDKTSNIRPLLSELANHIHNTIEESFEDEASPDGTKWNPIQPRKSDKNPNKILYDEGHLQGSLSSRVYADSLSVGVNATAKGYQYPIVHQFGTKDETIVARPFMPIKSNGELYSQTEKELEEIVEDYMEFLD